MTNSTPYTLGQKILSPAFFFILLIFVAGCRQEHKQVNKRIKRMDPQKALQLAESIEAGVTPQLADGLTLRLWAGDSLVADPIAVDVDDDGKLYYTRTNRQKNSEFDIRGHQEWEISSIRLQTVEDKRAFLHETLSPANSEKNTWLDDLNGDGSHDWKDMLVEKEHIYRLEDTNADGVADFSQLMVEDFHEEVTDVAGAVLKHGDDLFVGVAPDLWRMKDTDGDGIADKKTSISHGYGIHIGFGAHGMSGLEVGPDGKIYWGIGDIGFNGKGPKGEQWEYPNSGVIVRANPDGSDFEVFAAGVRNTHEFVFDEYGNLISVDNDGDHQGEKERLVYIVDGSDSGWRINWQFGKYRDPDNNTYKVWMDEQMFKPRFEGQAAYITPPIENFVSGPAGMLYNPGTALSPAWKNTFFIVEFVGNPSRSGIHAFKLKPKGATFELAEQKQILSGISATGIDFGPDGAMYVADWIEGWGTKEFGRIWKLDASDGTDNEERVQTRTLLAADFTAYKSGQLSNVLKHADMRVRQKAQFELANRDEEGLKVFEENIHQTDNQLARIHAIWGICQLARKDQRHATLLMPLLKDGDAEIRAQAARWLGDIRYREAGDALIPLLNDDNARVRFFAAEALGRIAYAPAVDPLINLLRRNNDTDAYIRHAGSLALSRIGKAEPIVALSNDPSRAVRIAAVVALRRLSHPDIANFLKDQDEFIVTEAARAINDDLSIEKALPALGEVLLEKRFTNEALIRRAINANLRVGTEKSMQHLIDYARREDAPLNMRIEAVSALSTWARPSVVDRVDGRYRGVIMRDPAAVKNKAGDMLSALLAHKALPLRLSAAKAIGRLKIDGAGPLLFTRLKNDAAPEMRVESLRALAAQEDGPMDDAIKQALSDKDKSVRIAGLDLLARMNISKELMVSLLAEAINTRTTEEKQSALLTLGTLPVENSQKVFNDLLDKFSKGDLPAEIQLELAEAVDSTRSQPLISRYKEITATLAPDTLASAYKGSLLGGDEDRGRNIFFRNQTAQCIRCHSYDDFGGNAGPRLNGVAARLTREQILESLINPSARIAPGFGTVALELKAGKTIRGILQKENDNSLVVKVGDKPDTLIQKDQILKRTNGASSMPPMGHVLSKREIRDLVSFLSTLKEDE